jgi:hypothetical protein
MTLFWHHWLEVFGFDPDHGDGTVEWLMISGLPRCACLTTAFSRWPPRREG